MTTLECPTSYSEEKVITLSHGSGGLMTGRLIEEMIKPAFNNPSLNMLHDGASITLPSTNVIFSTDSYVIQPIFFPGGDIGKLSVTGTINDLAMCGAKPLFLSCALIIEEGFLQSDLQKVIKSMAKEASANGASIVTGDTKIIERHKGTNLLINTSGIGALVSEKAINPLQIQEGDVILLSGDIARHGMAVMAQREGLFFSSQLDSDCMSLWPHVKALLDQGIDIHCMRDLTRGGLATALVELSETANIEIAIEEESIAVCDLVDSVCEILGFDPLYVANEGRFIIILPKEDAKKALKTLKAMPGCADASIIGVVSSKNSCSVSLENAFGTRRYLYKLVAEQLPRIC